MAGNNNFAQTIPQQMTVGRQVPVDFVLFQDSFGVKLSYNTQTCQLYNFQFGTISITILTESGEIVVVNGCAQTHFNVSYRIGVAEARLVARFLPIVLQSWSEAVDSGVTNFVDIMKHVRYQVDNSRVRHTPSPAGNGGEQQAQHGRQQHHQQQQPQQQQLHQPQPQQLARQLFDNNLMSKFE